MPNTTSLEQVEGLGRSQRLLLSGFLFLTAIFPLYFWLDFYLVGGVRILDTEVYLAFEGAFLAADAWMASASFVAGVALLKRSPLALLFGIAAGSALLFLGLMDVLFGLQQGIYTLGTSEVLLEVLINVYSLIFGAFLLVYFWYRRWAVLGVTRP